MASTNPARGMRDFLPAQLRKREYVIGIIKEVYESYGFEPLETPAVENIETLMGKYGEEGNQLIFKILKRGEKLGEAVQSYRVTELQSNRVAELQSSETDLNSGTLHVRNSENSLSDLALRYDLTVPLARVVANHKNELPKFFKRYQIQPVWRADRPARGRFREFYQCDVDAIGSESMVVEAELISAVSEILSRLGFDDFVVRLNHRDLLSGILYAVGTHEQRYADVLASLDKIDKIGVSGMLGELKLKRVHPDVGTGLAQLISKLQPLDNWATLAMLDDFVGNREAGKAGLRSLARIIELNPSANIRIDVSLARGLTYYTGTIMEINVPDLAGSLGGGGRYDGLIGMFGKEQIPACGFSLGLERILVVMDERGMFRPEIAESKPADVMVTIWSEATAGESLKLASELRGQGLSVTIYPDADKLGKQFKYASQINVPWVCVLGESELAENKVTLKNMLTGEQETLPRGEIAGRILRAD